MESVHLSVCGLARPRPCYHRPHHQLERGTGMLTIGRKMLAAFALIILMVLGVAGWSNSTPTKLNRALVEALQNLEAVMRLAHDSLQHSDHARRPHFLGSLVAAPPLTN